MSGVQRHGPVHEPDRPYTAEADRRKATERAMDRRAVPSADRGAYVIHEREHVGDAMRGWCEWCPPRKSMAELGVEP